MANQGLFFWKNSDAVYHAPRQAFNREPLIFGNSLVTVSVTVSKPKQKQRLDNGWLKPTAYNFFCSAYTLIAFFGLERLLQLQNCWTEHVWYA